MIERRVNRLTGVTGAPAGRGRSTPAAQSASLQADSRPVLDLAVGQSGLSEPVPLSSPQLTNRPLQLRITS